MGNPYRAGPQPWPARETQVKGDQIRVYMETDLGSLRAMLAAADLALKTWPGGDPQEQANLVKMRKDLYAITMDVLIEHGLI